MGPDFRPFLENVGQELSSVLESSGLVVVLVAEVEVGDSKSLARFGGVLESVLDSDGSSLLQPRFSGCVVIDVPPIFSASWRWDEVEFVG